MPQEKPAKEIQIDIDNGYMTLGKEERPITNPIVKSSPKKLSNKNLFGENKGDNVSGGASSNRKRSRIVDISVKSGNNRNITPI